MRLGRDVLEADLYGELGLLPNATESEIRLAYRQKVRLSHPDLNQNDPGAAARMTRLNIAAKVLLDPSLRRSYDRAPRSARKSPSSPPTRREWFERFPKASVALWWISAGHRPTVAEAVACLEHLQAHGPTPHAFSFREPFDPEGRPLERDAQWNECPTA